MKLNKKILLAITTCFFIITIYFSIKKIKNLIQPSNTYAVQEPIKSKIISYYYKISPHSHSIYNFLRRAYYLFGIPKKGIIHIGARNAEELPYYLNHNIKDILWIEADPECKDNLLKIISKHSGSKLAMFAATDTNGLITFRKTSNDGHSSSILKLKNHLLHYPSIVETKSFQVKQQRLDNYLSKQEQQKYNVIVIDVQGAELIALKGTINMLDHIDAIIAETNYDELYEGSVLIKDLDEFLSKHEFTRVESVSTAFYTGDAMYVKNKFFVQRK